MADGAHAQRLPVRLTTGRARRVLVASAVTLLTSALLLGLIGLIRWRGHQALQSDTHALMAQTAQQLVRSLQSRRGTLTFLRDTLKRRDDLSSPQLAAMGASAVEHTRHLLGVGLIEAASSPTWWSSPQGLSRADLAQLNRAIVQRTQLRGIWRVPSTFATTTASNRVLLVMLEPLRGRTPPSAIMGVFDVKPLLEDFFTAGPAQRHPVQLLDQETLLYRSSGWKPATDDPGWIIEEQPVAVDAARWTLQMQPGATRVAQTLSSFNVLLTALSVLAGLGVITIVWILAARTWILQRAVTRRTAALRRTLRRVRQLAITDELTGLYNRRFFLNRWVWECDRAKRYQRPLACLMIDVNGFKQVNDRLGHHAGDLVLQHVAQELKTLLRQSDIMARFGGDEFIVALPETSLEQATSVAEKLRQVKIQTPDGASHDVEAVTLSVGVSRIEDEDETPQQILDAADESLYTNKRRARTHATLQRSR